MTNFGTADELDKHLDRVLDHLYDDSRVIDPDYTATLAGGEVEFSLFVEAEDDLRAHELALPVLRAAIHGAEARQGGTRTSNECRR